MRNRKHDLELRELQDDVDAVRGPKLYTVQIEYVFALLALPKEEFAKLETDVANNEPWVESLDKLAVKVNNYRGLEKNKSKKRSLGLCL